MELTEKLEFIKTHDPEGGERLMRLLSRKSALQEGNNYGERFTDRQFSLVFAPLLETSFERATILEKLAEKEDTVSGLAENLDVPKERVFTHIKELIRKNLVEIAGHEDRDPIFRRRT